MHASMIKCFIEEKTFDIVCNTCGISRWKPVEPIGRDVNTE